MTLIKGIALQAVFGVDTIAAVALCAILGILFDVRVDVYGAFLYLGFALMCTYLPDTDFPLYLLLRKRYGLVSHWTLGHYPLIVIQGWSMLVSWYTANWDSGYFLSVIALCGVAAHFVHDSVRPMGLPWFWPLSNVRISFEHGLPEYTNSHLWERYLQKNRNRRRGLYDEIVIRLETISSWQIVTGSFFMFLFGLWPLSSLIY